MKSQLARAVVVASLLIAAAAFAAHGPVCEQRRDVVYGEVHGTGLLMDIFAPKGKSNGLAIVDVVSGAWYSDRNKIRDHTGSPCRRKSRFWPIGSTSNSPGRSRPLRPRSELSRRPPQLERGEYREDGPRPGPERFL